TDFVGGEKYDRAETVALEDRPRCGVKVDTAVVEREGDAFAGKRSLGLTRGAPLFKCRTAISRGGEMSDLLLEARGIEPVACEGLRAFIRDPMIHEDREVR